MLRNWKTTLGGLGSIFAGLAMAFQVLTGEGEGSFEVAFGLISVGVAGLLARDGGNGSDATG